MRQTLWIMLLVWAWCFWGCSLMAGKPEPDEEAVFVKQWEKIKQLEEEQKYSAALDEVVQIYKSATGQKMYGQMTKAMIKIVLLKRGLHNYETAARFLLEEKWPEPPRYEALVRLFYVGSLWDYYNRYSWEINQREKVVSQKGIDVKQWTAFDMFEEINKQYLLLWEKNDLLATLPVKDYPDYITAGGYPPDIRPTLRDFMVYQWAEFLGNTNTWRPYELKEKYKLDLATLAASAETRPAFDLEQMRKNDVHPLLKMAAILDELYRLASKMGKPESALETQLEKWRRLAMVFSEKYQLDILIANATKVLPAFDKYGWWAAGQYEYAVLLEKKGELVLAHDAALLGSQKYPQSMGGQRCLYLAKSIEAPDFQVTTMTVDRPLERSIQIRHKNISQLHLAAYEINFWPWFMKPYRYLGSVDYNELRDVVHKKKPELLWRVELSNLGDYQYHTTYVTAPLDKFGFYFIAAAAKRDFTATPENRIAAATFLLSPMTVVTNSRDFGWEVFVMDGTSGKPVAGAQVTLYQYNYNGSPIENTQQVSDARGYVYFQPRDNDYNSYYVVVSKGKNLAYHPGTIYFSRPYTHKEVTRGCFIYTDRSIYRPLQKVFFKIAAYQGDAETCNYRCVPRTAVNTSLFDANGKMIATVTSITNDYGTAAGEFMIPTGLVLGQYSLRCYAGTHSGYTSFRVEEYKRPTFEVTLKESKNPLRLNDLAKLEGEARYYFGLPVTTGKVFYRVTREPVLPWWYWWYYPSSGQTRNTYEIAARETTVDSDGTFKIEFTPEADPSLGTDPETSYNFRVEAELTDEGGETRNASRSYAIGFVAVRASLEESSGFFTGKQQASFTITRSDLNGVPQAGAGQYRLVALKTPERLMIPSSIPLAVPAQNQATAGDKLRPRWEADKPLEQYLFFWEDDKPVSDGKLDHGSDGVATANFQDLAAGVYRLYYNTQDAFGKPYQTRKDFVVAGVGLKLNVPLFLLAQKTHRKVGEEALFLLGSGMAGQNYWLELYQSSRLIKRELRQAKDGDVWEISLQENHRGGFTVRVFGVYDYGLYSQSENIYVPWDNKHLKVTFKTFRDLLQPGQKEKWTVAVSGQDSKAVAAEILAYMYDRSLDFFTPHHYPTWDSLLPNKQGAPWLGVNLSYQGLTIIWEERWNVLPAYVYYQADRLSVFDSYPIGGLGTRRGYLYAEAPGAVEDAPAPTRAPLSPPMEKSAELKSAKNGAKADLVLEKPAPPAQPVSTAAVTDPANQQAKQEEAPIRANFQETAFFLPQLTTDKNGEANIEFEIPDSVTSWKVYLHAMTKDIRFMTLDKEVVTRKDLMVRPYVPRFLREGDNAVLKVVVNNATDTTLAGQVYLTILDDKNVDKCELFGVTVKSQEWKADGKKSANVSWEIKAPGNLGLYTFQVIAKTPNFSDGELRPVPVLPGRMHLIQSKFATVKENEPRTLKLADLAKAREDATLIHDSLTVTVDAQLIYTVLKSLPYLTDYPYECVEQTLNRFLATGIVSSLYSQYPPIEKMAQEFAKRQTQLDPWNQQDANRKMALEETPWLNVAEGGSQDMRYLINVLDAKIAKAHREMALEKLQKAQLGNGAFPWFPGGPPSSYMTLYLVHGFAKAQEFKVEIPVEMVRKAWIYLAEEFRNYYVQKMLIEDYGYEFITFLNYVLSCYKNPDYYRGAFSEEERQQMLAFSWKHWKKHSPYLKAYLALTLQRNDRPKDARLVIESIMDSAQTKEDQGTFWAPEDRGWLWYNDGIESHAFILRALQEIKPEDTKLVDGLMLWLLINKKCNQWKSTRTTAEVIYSLVYTMSRQKALAVRETASVTLGSNKHQMVFEPDRYTGGNNQIVVAGRHIVPESMSQILVEKTGPGFMFASVTWHYSTEKMPQEARGDFLAIERKYFLRKHEGKEFILKPLADGVQVQVGDQLEVQVSIRAKHPMEYVHLRDPRGAGFEPEQQVSGHKWNLGICWYEEVRDSGMNFFFENLPQGEYPFSYRLRANMAGKFKVGPATIQSMYAPEFAGFSSGAVLEVAK